MTYVTEDITSTLKEARESKGLSQRELSKKAGVPQSHISKIESGAVDLRLSSLIGLARVLDLELALVPRKTVPAVQSIVRTSAASTWAGLDAGRRAAKELERFKTDVANSPLIGQTSEIAQLQRQIRELEHFKLGKNELQSLKKAHKAYTEFSNDPHSKWMIQQIISDLRGLRNMLAHSASTIREVEPARPAYSLDEENESA